MLPRPWHLPNNYTSQLPKAAPTWTSGHRYHNISASDTHLTRLCDINPFNSHDPSWNKTRARLVAKWTKTVFRRRFHSLKRSMVKQLTPGKNAISHSAGLSTESASITTEQSLVYGDKPCPRDLDACKKELNRDYVGRNLETPFDRGIDITIVSMEGNKAAIATQRSTHGREDREGERTQTPEEYIARRKQLAVDRVMADFQKWFDKELSIISYTIEASDAAGGTSDSISSTGSESGGTGEQSSNGSSGRPKRQLYDDDHGGLSGGGDDNGQDRGGNKRAKKDTEPEEMKFACPFHKHNPKAHRKSVCTRAWPSIHRLKQHLYRVHLLPKHNCPRCTSSFENEKELQIHLRADEPCKKSDLIPEEGIDQDTEKRLKERQKHKSGLTETQRWNDIYLLLFPGTDRNALPSPYPDHVGAAMSSKHIENYKRVEKRLKKELPPLVRQRVERKFEKMENEVLCGLNDIVRGCLFEFFKNMSSDEGSASVTPQTTSRATTPGPLLAEEPSTIPGSQTNYPEIDLNYFLDGEQELGFINDISIFNYTPQLDTNDAPSGYGMDKVVSDSGYASTNTMRGFQ
ncbi:hypothetical protein F5Y19DRAFT_206759 [Xylariaceae sp. FL1651]|nr:hypothetical protein F5Y19DRAFT_206759 [Xylariaceae sp. FL1651]